MKIAGIYSFNKGREIIEADFAPEYQEVQEVIAAVEATIPKTTISKEKTMPRKVLYQPGAMNKAFKREFGQKGWQNHKIAAEYPTEFYMAGYEKPKTVLGGFRNMDCVKNQIGVEIQFGKYASMVYSGAAKMTIFHNQGIIDVGVEIVPVKELADDMSTGISYFEQFVWDLERRGVADIDIPVLIVGITI